MIEWMNWTQASKSIAFFVALLISLLGVAINFYIAISKHFFYGKSAIQL
ncbi:hypothetical protein PS627_02057 [Pseudomonas fluorescens]|nr:hypothetical protein PS627_02057 [Pseudomonas fluorescens]VVP90119.1 hypothetical protein PS910_02797 [Pseudomonas fluorescens]